MEIAFDVALPHCGDPPRCRRCVTHHPWEKPVTERQQPGLAEAIDDHLIKTVGVSPGRAGPIDLMLATAQVAREQLSRRWVNTRARERDSRARRVYYLSMEFLIGRTLSNALGALDLQGRSVEGEADGLTARVFQHETDHLDGIVYPMRMPDLSRLGFVEELSRFGAQT